MPFTPVSGHCRRLPHAFERSVTLPKHSCVARWFPLYTSANAIDAFVCIASSHVGIRKYVPLTRTIYDVDISLRHSLLRIYPNTAMAQRTWRASLCSGNWGSLGRPSANLRTASPRTFRQLRFFVELQRFFAAPVEKDIRF